MTFLAWSTLALLASLFATLVLSSLTYSLRDYSRARLEERLTRFNRLSRFDSIVSRTPDLIFITAGLRLLANLAILISILVLLEMFSLNTSVHYTLGIFLFMPLGLLSSVALPTAIAKYQAEQLIAILSDVLNLLYILFYPATYVMHAAEKLVLSTSSTSQPSEEIREATIEEDILAAVEEGTKSGVVDEAEADMIQSVIQFRDTTAGQIMTPRRDIVAIPASATFQQTLDLLERTGHSRLPVISDDLDHINGIFYSRDLLHHLADGIPSSANFSIRVATRPAFFVPETKPLRDLLKDFRLQKIHIAIVLDEFGGTAGLITIEDVLEELVGDISDEHEANEPAMIKQLSDAAWEADARIDVEELNRSLGLSIPDDQGFDTLGGFVAHQAGQIPRQGWTFDTPTARYTVLAALPQRVLRVRIDLTPASVSPDSATTND